MCLLVWVFWCLKSRSSSPVPEPPRRGRRWARNPTSPVGQVTKCSERPLSAATNPGEGPAAAADPSEPAALRPVAPARVTHVSLRVPSPSPARPQLLVKRRDRDTTAFAAFFFVVFSPNQRLQLMLGGREPRGNSDKRGMVKASLSQTRAA